jgi:hypothetical protein
MIGNYAAEVNPALTRPASGIFPDTSSEQV